MQQENTGKIITKIRPSEKKVTIYFSKEKLEISLEAYSNSYLYVGKSLTRKEINDLNRMTSLDAGLKYALNLLKKSIYTEYRMREKLYSKELNKNEVDSIIKFLKQNDLINDDAFIEDFLLEAEEKNYGKYKIIQKLNDLGIFEDKIKKIKFLESKEIEKAKRLLPNLDRKYKNYNFEKKKSNIYNALIRQGFDSSVASSVIKNVKPSPEKEEQRKLKEDYLKALKKAEQKYPDNRFKQKEYIFNHLVGKGYRYVDVVKEMEK